MNIGYVEADKLQDGLGLLLLEHTLPFTRMKTLSCWKQRALAEARGASNESIQG
jgi:hypothetical protein